VKITVGQDHDPGGARHKGRVAAEMGHQHEEGYAGARSQDHRGADDVEVFQDQIWQWRASCATRLVTPRFRRLRVGNPNGTVPQFRPIAAYRLAAVAHSRGPAPTSARGQLVVVLTK